MPKTSARSVRAVPCLLFTVLLGAAARSAVAGVSAPAAAALAEMRVDLSFLQCVDPPDSTCTAASEEDKARCPACKSWEPRRLDYRAEPQLLTDSIAYRAKANVFLRDATHSIYGVEYPLLNGQPVRVQELYRDPERFGWIEVSPEAAGPGALVAFKSSLGAVIVSGHQGDLTAPLGVVFPSAKAEGALRKANLADLVKESGTPKFLIPRSLTAEAPQENIVQVVRNAVVRTYGDVRLDAAARNRLEQLGEVARQTPGAKIVLAGFSPRRDGRVEMLTQSAQRYLVSSGVSQQQVKAFLPTDTQTLCPPGLACGPLSPNVSATDPKGSLTATISFAPGEYWNTWAEEADADADPLVNKNLAADLRYQKVQSLKINTTYLIALHLSGFPYDFENATWSLQSRPAGPDFEQSVDKALAKHKTSWELRAIVFPGPLLRNEPVVIDDLLPVHLDRIAKYRKSANAKPPDHPLAELAQNRDRPYAFGEIAFAVTTGDQTGLTGIGISLWDEGDNRPVDEITIPLCIGEEPCQQQAVPYLGLAGPGLMDLATGAPPENLPDASLHIFEMGERIVGVFHRRDQPDQYPRWTITQKPENFKSSLKSLQAAFGNGMDPVQVGKDLAGQLFPRDDNAQKKAREQFQSFLDSRGAAAPFAEQPPPRLFVRMVLGSGGDRGSSLFPLGLLHPGTADDDAFVGYRFRVESPLPRQTYQSPEGCLEKWLMVIPPKSEDKELQKGREILGGRLDSLNEFTMAKLQYPRYQNFKDFLSWLNEAALRGGDSAAVVVLSHHDERNLSFTPKEEPLRPESLQSLPANPFSGPSFAVLDSCSGLAYGADMMVKELNVRGIGTVIATTNQVSGDLAGHFLECLVGVMETAPSPHLTASDLFYQAQRCLWNRQEGFGPQVLSFSMVGNPSVNLCSPRKP